MSRYIKCRLTLETPEEFNYLLNLIERDKSGFLDENNRNCARDISSALKFHRDSTGYRKMGGGGGE